ncbi:hypothetical protein PM082_009558 [Marasmius tenuissimus]|nr:hypothetical protein PM082_009558 [Marasmius tenuissimus]
MHIQGIVVTIYRPSPQLPRIVEWLLPTLESDTSPTHFAKKKANLNTPDLTVPRSLSPANLSLPTSSMPKPHIVLSATPTILPAPDGNYTMTPFGGAAVNGTSSPQNSHPAILSSHPQDRGNNSQLSYPHPHSYSEVQGRDTELGVQSSWPLAHRSQDAR